MLQYGNAVVKFANQAMQRMAVVSHHILPKERPRPGAVSAMTNRSESFSKRHPADHFSRFFRRAEAFQGGALPPGAHANEMRKILAKEATSGLSLAASG